VSALADVIATTVDVRGEVADLGPGWWLAGMRRELAHTVQVATVRHPDPAQVRERLVRHAAMAVLAVESFDAEQATREARRAVRS
jgi:hypothetical protein